MITDLVSPDVRICDAASLQSGRDGRDARLHGAGALERRKGFRCFRCLCSRSDSPRDGRWAAPDSRGTVLCSVVSTGNPPGRFASADAIAMNRAPVPPMVSRVGSRSGPGRNLRSSDAIRSPLRRVSQVRLRGCYRSSRDPRHCLERSRVSLLASKEVRRRWLTFVPFSQVLRNHVHTPEKDCQCWAPPCTARNDSDHQ